MRRSRYAIFAGSPRCRAHIAANVFGRAAFAGAIFAAVLVAGLFFAGFFNGGMGSAHCVS
jgi:hypothetical protein